MSSVSVSGNRSCPDEFHISRFLLRQEHPRLGKYEIDATTIGLGNYTLKRSAAIEFKVRFSGTLSFWDANGKELQVSEVEFLAHYEIRLPTLESSLAIYDFYDRGNKSRIEKENPSLRSRSGQSWF